MDTLSDRLFRRAYVTDLYQPLMDLADVVVTRGGSNTQSLAPLLQAGAIVPLGREASRGDQIEKWIICFVKKGYAVKLEERSANFRRGKLLWNRF